MAWEAVTRAGLVAGSGLAAARYRRMRPWFDLAVGGDLWTNGVASISRGAAGLALAIVVGSLIGVLMAWYTPVRIVVNPIVQFFYPMPKSALIPVMVLWLGFGDASKIATDLHRLPAAGDADRLQRRARHRAGADLVGAQPGREPLRASCGRWCCRARCRSS